MRRSPLNRLAAVPVAVLAVALAVPAGALGSAQSGLRKSLATVMKQAPSPSGAYVRDAESGKRLFAWKQATPRILASNTKIFTVGTALGRHGPDGRLVTRVMIHAPLRGDGSINGNLFLVGAGDPAFGGRGYVRENYGLGGATAEKLADNLYDAGLRDLRGTVVGDESAFDTLRSGPSEGYGPDSDVGGPLSALAFNHGLTSSGYFQSHPAAYAADRVASALRRRGISVKNSARGGAAPDGSEELARVRSLPLARIAQLTAIPSDNYFAELLAKEVGGGTTAGGATAIRRFAKRRGASIKLADGSGLSRSNQAAPQEIVRFFDHEQDHAAEFDALYRALPIAGVNGTLSDRMRSGPAHHHCRAKTGTISGVSTLSGFCDSRGGSRLIFSILMNGVTSDDYAHSLQDRMAQSMAKYKG